MQHHEYRIDLFSVAMLFVSIVLIVLVFVGMVRQGSSSLFLIPPLALGIRAILNLREDR